MLATLTGCALSGSLLVTITPSRSSLNCRASEVVRMSSEVEKWAEYEAEAAREAELRAVLGFFVRRA
jgi:hypothetical protein